jgi:hypothetical protein
MSGLRKLREFTARTNDGREIRVREYVHLTAVLDTVTMSAELVEGEHYFRAVGGEVLRQLASGDYATADDPATHYREVLEPG